MKAPTSVLALIIGSLAITLYLVSEDIPTMPSFRYPEAFAQTFGLYECPAASAVGGFAEAECKSNKIKEIINSTIKNITTDPEIQTLKAQDPQFAAFTSIGQGCFGVASAPMLTMEQCQPSVDQATMKWCGLEQYNEQKCRVASYIAANVTQANSYGTDIGNFLGSMHY